VIKSRWMKCVVNAVHMYQIDVYKIVRKR